MTISSTDAARYYHRELYLNYDSHDDTSLAKLLYKASELGVMREYHHLAEGIMLHPQAGAMTEHTYYESFLSVRSSNYSFMKATSEKLSDYTNIFINKGKLPQYFLNTALKPNRNYLLPLHAALTAYNLQKRTEEIPNLLNTFKLLTPGRASRSNIISVNLNILRNLTKQIEENEDWSSDKIEPEKIQQTAQILNSLPYNNEYVDSMLQPLSTPFLSKLFGPNIGRELMVNMLKTEIEALNVED